MRLTLESFTHCDLLKIKKQNRPEKKNKLKFVTAIRQFNLDVMPFW